MPVFLFTGLISAELSCDTSNSKIFPCWYKSIHQITPKIDQEFPKQAAPMSRELARLKEIERILSNRIGRISGINKMIKKPPEIPAMQQELERLKKMNEILFGRIINLWLY